LSAKTNASASAEPDAAAHPVSIVPPDTDAGSPGGALSASGAVDTPDEPAEAAAQPLFSDLGLSEPIQRAIDEAGYIHPTPIQAQAIPYVLMGRDVLGVAQTGTGKTAGFTLPMLEILSGPGHGARMPRSLILEPTRELALQVAENFVKYGKYLKLNHALLIGGESMAEQKDALNRGVDVLIATPGRLIDLFERGGLLLTQTRLLVIDEADRMLDMGFIPDIEKIVGMLPPLRQTLFFSATMAPESGAWRTCSCRTREITVSRPSSVATTIEAGLVVVDEDDKRRVLRQMLRDDAVQNAIIFCNRKRDVDVLCNRWSSTASPPARCMATCRSRSGSRRSNASRPATSNSWSAPTSRRAASISAACRTSSISTCRSMPKIMCTDRPHRPRRRTGHAYSLASPHDRGLAEAIEKLIGHPIPRLAVEGVTQLDWSEEARPRGGKGRGRGREKDDRRGPKPARPAAAPAAPTEASPRPRPPPHRRQRASPRRHAIIGSANWKTPPCRQTAIRSQASARRSPPSCCCPAGSSRSRPRLTTRAPIRPTNRPER
jgi:superfamily II DNA/RNA helicase